VPVRELAHIKVDQVCIGSCTTSSLADLMTVARMLKGKTVADTDDMAELYSLYGALNCTDWVDYHADAAEMADVYGINEASGITVNYKKSVDVTDASGNAQSTFMDAAAKVYFGSAAPDGSGVYYTLPKSSIVYIMENELYGQIMEYLNYIPPMDAETAA